MSYFVGDKVWDVVVVGLFVVGVFVGWIEVLLVVDYYGLVVCFGVGCEFVGFFGVGCEWFFVEDV